MANITITPPKIDRSSKALFKDFRKFKGQCNHIFQGPLHEFNDAGKVNYIMMWVSAEGERIICNQPAPPDNTPIAYFEAFEKYIRLVSTFCVAKHRFYQLKQEKDEVIDIFLLRCRHTLEECCFPDAQCDSMLLHRVIYGVKHEESQCTLLSMGEDLTLERTLEIIHAKEVTDSSYKEVFQQDIKSVDAVHKKSNYLRFKDNQCYNCGGQHKWDHSHCPAKSSACHYCHKMGHFEKVCITNRSNPRKININQMQ